QFAAPSYTIKKTSGPQNMVVTVSRTGATGSAQGVTVFYHTFAGFARPGVDYNDTSGTLSFGPGVMSQTFNVPILATSSVPPEFPEDFAIELLNPTGGAVLGTRNFVAGSITEATAPTTMQLSGMSGFLFGFFPEYHATEIGHSFNVTVTRSGPTTGTSSVTLGTFNGTAIAGTHYVATNAVLNFFPGQTSKTVSIPILDPETINTGVVYFGVILFNNSGGELNSPVPPYAVGFPGFPPLAFVAIGQDVETGGKVQFSSTSYAGSISGGAASIVLTRTGGTAANTNVFVSTSGGNPGTDYTSFSGNVTFGAFQTSVAFPITILGGATVGDTFNVNISSVNNGGSVGTPSLTTVTIAP
ncbi:MAG TPA: Calx-beta domain-containing protein, partial [Vicinamibacteria bacterium]|nr:Calx-beta domain-containing protein [Vicinamibacteria bacterium]